MGDLTREQSRVIEAAKAVLHELGGGYDESVYQEAMAVLFRISTVAYDLEVSVPILFHGHTVGIQRLDFMVYQPDKTIVELKAVKAITAAHRLQLMSYLRTCKVMSPGILINFPPEGPLEYEFVKAGTEVWGGAAAEFGEPHI